MSDRITARIVGGLFIVATICGVVGLALQQPIIDAQDYLAKASLNEDRMATGVLLQLIMGIAAVSIAIVIYPVLRRNGERLALGYIVARTVEGVIYVLGAIGLLTLLTVSRGFVAAGSDASTLQRLADLLLAERDWAGHAVLDATAFGLSAVILNYALYRAALVPRWLSVWGMAGAAAYLAAGVLVMYGMEALSTTQVVLDMPLGIQEMTLAVWLIVKGFAAPSLMPASHPVKQPIASSV